MSNMVIKTNVMALNSHRNLKTVGALQTRASQRLSSGYKINSAADDAAGLAISEKMRSQIRGLDMASKNTQDGVSLIQTAEGGMQEIDNMVQRIRELVVQVANDSNENNFSGTGDRQKIQDEIDQLVQEIDSMSERVEFNNKKVISGKYADVTEALAVASAEFAAMDTYRTALGTASANMTAKKAEVGGKRGEIAEKSQELEALIASNGTAAEIETAKGELSDLKTALDTLKLSLADLEKTYDLHVVNTEKAKAASLQVSAFKDMQNKGSETLFFQVGANANQKLLLNINSVHTNALGIGDGKGNAKIDVVKSTGSEITGKLAVLDKALTFVTTERSKLGAAQNRLEFTMKSLDISSENLSASESRIRNTDMAKEMMNLTQANVLQQAATSMLAQANQAPQSILQLLQ